MTSSSIEQEKPTPNLFIWNAVLLIMRMIQSRFMGKDIAFTPLRTHETEMHAEHGNTNYDGAMTTRLYENGENNRNVELTGLAYQK